MTEATTLSTRPVALVTGGSGAIGAAICRALAPDMHVLVGYRSDLAAAEEVAADLPSAEAVEIDVVDPESVAAAIARASDTGTLRVVVNNAGITSDALLVRLSEQEWARTLQVNLTGAFLVTQASVRPMLRARDGRIINVSSIVGLRGNAGQSAYAASKAGLVGLTRSVAREFARKGVTANVVAPGFVESPMTDALPERARDALVELAPIGRPIDPSEVAAAVAFLAAPAAAAITGVVLPVDGGAAM